MSPLPVTFRSVATLLPAALVLSLAAPAPSQGPGELPTDRSVAFARAVGRLEIDEALRIGLNSPGDEMSLYLEGGLSLGVGANVGAAAGIDAVARRLDSGGVEIVVGHEVAASLGIEAYEGLECNATMAGTRSVLFAWPTAADAARGLDLLAGGHRVAVSSLGNSVRNVIDTLRYAHGALREAILQTAVAQELYHLQSQAYTAASARLADLRRDAARARHHLHRAERAVRAAERKLHRVPRWLRGAARAVLRSVSRSLSRNGFLYRTISLALRAAEETAAAAQIACEARRAQLDRAYADEDSAQRMVESAEAAGRDIGEFVSVLVAAGDELLHNLRGVEFVLTGGAEVSAAVGPAGIDLENVGAGVSAAAALGGRVGYRVLDGGDESITVALFYDAGATAWAGMGVGVRSEVGYGVEIETEWLKHDARSGYQFGDLVTSIEADVSVQAVVGAGVALRRGVGQSFALRLNADQWASAMNSLSTLGGGMTTENLVVALDGLSCDVELRRRWITELVARGGGSYAGTGVNMEAGATWDDHGPALVETVNAGEIAELMWSAAWQRRVTKRLAALL